MVAEKTIDKYVVRKMIEALPHIVVWQCCVWKLLSLRASFRGQVEACGLCANSIGVTFVVASQWPRKCSVRGFRKVTVGITCFWRLEASETVSKSECR